MPHVPSPRVGENDSEVHRDVFAERLARDFGGFDAERYGISPRASVSEYARRSMLQRDEI